MRHRLLAGIAMCGAIATASAHAQVQTPGFFGNLDGFYSLAAGNVPGGITLNDNIGFLPTARELGAGFGGKLHAGYQFAVPWDIAIGLQYTNWREGKKDTQLGGFRRAWLTDGKLWAIDGEAGYTVSGPGYGVRPFVGVRYFHATYEGWDNLFNIGNEGKAWGIGPRAGADASVNVGGSVSLFGGVDVALLFGKVKNDNRFPGFLANSNDSRTMWSINGRIGVDWEIAPLVHLAAGFQFDYWQAIQHHVLANTFAGNGRANGHSDRINYGPFIRLAYNWGAGPSVAPPAPVPGVESFMVFFDFDRANLTPTALTTIKQAAAQAKAGNKTRIGVTGHTDRAGSDSYNMALSLRRANAVKDQLVREGIAANQIAVVGKGESEPLVPTADGVREPQNRRVVIVLS